MSLESQGEGKKQDDGIVASAQKMAADALSSASVAVSDAVNNASKAAAAAGSFIANQLGFGGQDSDKGSDYNAKGAAAEARLGAGQKLIAEIIKGQEVAAKLPSTGQKSSSEINAGNVVHEENSLPKITLVDSQNPQQSKGSSEQQPAAVHETGRVHGNSSIPSEAITAYSAAQTKVAGATHTSGTSTSSDLPSSSTPNAKQQTSTVTRAAEFASYTPGVLPQIIPAQITPKPNAPDDYNKLQKTNESLQEITAPNKINDGSSDKDSSSRNKEKAGPLQSVVNPGVATVLPVTPQAGVRLNQTEKKQEQASTFPQILAASNATNNLQHTEARDGSTCKVDPTTRQVHPTIGQAVERQPVVLDKQSGAAEKLPAVPDKQSGAVEKLPAVPDKQSGAAEKLPAVPDKQPGAVDKHTAPTEGPKSQPQSPGNLIPADGSSCTRTDVTPAGPQRTTPPTGLAQVTAAGPDGSSARDRAPTQSTGVDTTKQDSTGKNHQPTDSKNAVDTNGAVNAHGGKTNDQHTGQTGVTPVRPEGTPNPHTDQPTAANGQGRTTPGDPQLPTTGQGRTTPGEPQLPPTGQGRTTPGDPQLPTTGQGRTAPGDPQLPTTGQGRATPGDPQLPGSGPGKSTPGDPQTTPTAQGKSVPGELPAPDGSRPAPPGDLRRAADPTDPARISPIGTVPTSQTRDNGRGRAGGDCGSDNGSPPAPSKGGDKSAGPGLPPVPGGGERGNAPEPLLRQPGIYISDRSAQDSRQGITGSDRSPAFPLTSASPADKSPDRSPPDRSAPSEKPTPQEGRRTPGDLPFDSNNINRFLSSSDGKNFSPMPDRQITAETKAPPQTQQDRSAPINETARIAPLVDQFFLRHPDLSHLPKDAAIAELIRQLREAGIIGGANCIPESRALEIIKGLLQQRDGFLRQPYSEMQSQARTFFAPSFSDGNIIGKPQSVQEKINNQDKLNNQEKPNNPAQQLTWTVDQNGRWSISRQQESQAANNVRPSWLDQSNNQKTDYQQAQQRNDARDVRDANANDRSQAQKWQAASDLPASGVRASESANNHIGNHAGKHHHTYGGEQQNHPNAIKHPDRKDVGEKFGEVPNDKHNQPVDDRDPWIGIIGAGALGGILRSDDKRGDKKSGRETKSSANETKSPDRRTRYIVQFGETLELIASKKLGDVRFAQLILTINRGSIRYRNEGFKRVPDLRTGQVLWLPSQLEMEIHRKHFFPSRKSPLPIGYRSEPSSGAPAAADSAQNSHAIDQPQEPPTFEWQTGDRIVAAVPEGMTTYAVSPTTPETTTPTVSPTIAETYTVESTILEQMETPALLVVDGDRLLTGQEYQAVEPASSVPTSTIPIKQTASSEPAPLSLVLLKIRKVGNRPSMRLEDLPSLTDAGSQPRPAFQPSEERNGSTTCAPCTAAEIEARMTINKLSEQCRVLVADPGSKAAVFITKLQASIAGHWTTIAAYESRFGQTVRFVYNNDGSREPFHMDLPPEVVKDMSKEDFRRNWQNYLQGFVQQPVRPSGFQDIPERKLGFSRS